MSLEPLCPDLYAWRVSLVSVKGKRILMHLEPVRARVPCPVCGTESARVHSRYQRVAWDMAWGKWPVQLVVHSRRFFCGDEGCVRRIFTEPFPGVLERYGRQTARLKKALLELAHSSGAEAAARVGCLLGYATSGDTLLRLQRAEVFTFVAPMVLGVDEFALRRGWSYDTIVVDLERHCPVAVLDGRDTQPFAAWLRGCPGVAVIARDRGGAYAAAGRTAAPNALQVADRFHLVRNVGDALKEMVRSRRWKMPGGPSDALQATVPLAEQPKERKPTPLKLALWEEVQRRKDKGMSKCAIAREVGINRKTVMKYLTLDHPPVCAPRIHRPTKVTPYLSYLRQRWLEGCHSARQLYHELLRQGFHGAERKVRKAISPWRSAPGPPPRRSSSLHWLVLRPSRRLNSTDREDLEEILRLNPELALGYRLKEGFHQLVAQRDVVELDRWIGEAAQSGLRAFKTLAKTFRHDYEAIKAALTTPWSTAQVEGQNTRVKLIKRLGYGRAKLDLLQARILHRAAA
ncbi:MAG: ISL3 family transposase [Chloroflexota bacterium]|nr:ISL3 family transposase [Chloroflexota bacterium]